MGTPEIEAFLTHLAVDRKVAASTQNQALSAHAEGLQRSLGDEGWCTSVEIGRWLFRSSADFAFHRGPVPRQEPAKAGFCRLEPGSGD